MKVIHGKLDSHFLISYSSIKVATQNKVMRFSSAVRPNLYKQTAHSPCVSITWSTSFQGNRKDLSHNYAIFSDKKRCLRFAPQGPFWINKTGFEMKFSSFKPLSLCLLKLSMHTAKPIHLISVNAIHYLRYYSIWIIFLLDFHLNTW